MARLRAAAQGRERGGPGGPMTGWQAAARPKRLERAGARAWLDSPPVGALSQRIGELSTWTVPPISPLALTATSLTLPVIVNEPSKRKLPSGTSKDRSSARRSRAVTVARE